MKIDVVVPVFRNPQLTEACLASIVASAENDVLGRLIVVNDASPEPQMADICNRFVEQVAGEAIVHEANKGFVCSVNAGIRESGDRDVVIVNSDTKLPSNWLERISQAAAGRRDCASITPFSNNASICSYPRLCEDNAIPPSLGFEALDRLFAKANAGLAVEIPTGVGFCMYLRREALDEVGLFDEEAFGRGYGEENDWCLRASAKGWKHYLCADLYVYHAGGASFGAEAEQLQGNAMAVIASRYPDYERQIADFVEADPIEPARHAVDLLRPDTTVVVSESRARERAERASRYALDRQRHDQVTRLDQLLVETREAAKDEAGQYESILMSARAEAASREAQYQAQVEEMAAGYAALNTEHKRLSRFWIVRFWSGLMRRLGR